LAFLPRLPNYIFYRARPVLVPSELPQAYSRWLERDRALRPLNLEANAFQIVQESPRRKQREPGRPSPTGVFALLPGSQDRLFRLTTISSSHFWNAGIRRFVRRTYPFVSSILLDQNEIREVLLKLEAHLRPNRQLIITDLGLREPRPGLSAEKKVQRFDADRRWTEASLHDILVQVKERGQWFTSVGFAIVRHDLVRDLNYIDGHGRLRRNGELHLDSLFPDLSDSILTWVEEAGARRVRLLTNRGLRERNYAPAKPIAIEFPQSVFADQKELRRLAAILARYPSSTKAVYHSNPYYHASIADVKDGSSIDVWVLNQSRILLVPQGKSTAPAYSRLISHIFTYFSEGTVSEFDGDRQGPDS
jgi:hypothetical protein